MYANAHAIFEMSLTVLTGWGMYLYIVYIYMYSTCRHAESRFSKAAHRARRLIVAGLS